MANSTMNSTVLSDVLASLNPAFDSSVYKGTSILGITPHTDTKTGSEIIYPTYETLHIPQKPNYINKVRVNVNSYGTTELSKFSGTPEDLIHDIGADFKAIRTPAYRMLPNGEFAPVENNSFLINSKTNDIIGQNITDRYSVFNFDDGIYYFMSFIEAVQKHGYNCTPAYGKVWDKGARMFLQYKIEGGKILDEPMEYYASLVSSHDKSSGFIITLSAVRLFCQNQVHRMLKNAPLKITLKHTTGNQSRLETEAAKMIAAQQNQKIALTQYCESLSNIKVTNVDILNAFAKVAGLENMTTQRQVDNFASQANQLFACYNMDDVNNFRNTALGAYYAFSDYNQHVIPARKTADQTFIERGLDGNLELGNFVDTLVEMVA